MSSVGGDVLYVYTSCEMIGPRVDCSAWGGKEVEEVEAEGLDKNYITVSASRKERHDMKLCTLRWSSPRNVKGILLHDS